MYPLLLISQLPSLRLVWHHTLGKYTYSTWTHFNVFTVNTYSGLFHFTLCENIQCTNENCIRKNFRIAHRNSVSAPAQTCGMTILSPKKGLFSSTPPPLPRLILIRLSALSFRVARLSCRRRTTVRPTARPLGHRVTGMGSGRISAAQVGDYAPINTRASSVSLKGKPGGQRQRTTIDAAAAALQGPARGPGDG